MKLSELRPCDNCGGPIGPHSFYVVRITQAFIKPDAANQVLGMTQYFGGHLGLAEIMCPEPEAVMIAGDEDSNLMTELFLCEKCHTLPDKPTALGEMIGKRIEAQELAAEKISE